MRVSYKYRVNRWTAGKRWRRSIRRTKRKCDQHKTLGGTVRKEGRRSSEPALAQIVKDSKACPQHGAPIRCLRKLTCNSQSRRHVSIGCLVERSATGRERDRRWIVQARHGDRIVCRVLALRRRIDIPSQAISERESRCDPPGILTIKRKVF